jgi:DNA-binding NtrC family response regulator
MPFLERGLILIVSDDTVKAALLAALVETAGFRVGFPRPLESASEAMRRLRPGACLIDCDDSGLCNDETLGHAMMRGIATVVFGTHEALDRSRALVVKHHAELLSMPPDPGAVDAVLRHAGRTTTL